MSDPQHLVARIERAWDRLSGQYSTSCAAWHDEKLNEFSTRYWSPLESAIRALLRTAGELSQAIAESQRAIPDE